MGSERMGRRKVRAEGGEGGIDSGGGVGLDGMQRQT